MSSVPGSSLAHDELFLIGTQEEILAALDADGLVVVESQIPELRSIYLSVGIYVPGARYLGLFPLHEAVYSLVAGLFAIGNPLPTTVAELQGEHLTVFQRLAKSLGLPPESPKANELLEQLGTLKENKEYASGGLMGKVVTKSAVPKDAPYQWIARLTWFPGGMKSPSVLIGHKEVSLALVKVFLKCYWALGRWPIHDVPPEPIPPKPPPRKSIAPQPRPKKKEMAQ